MSSPVCTRGFLMAALKAARSRSGVRLANLRMRSTAAWTWERHSSYSSPAGMTSRANIILCTAASAWSSRSVRSESFRSRLRSDISAVSRCLVTRPPSSTDRILRRARGYLPLLVVLQRRAAPRRVDVEEFGLYLGVARPVAAHRARYAEESLVARALGYGRARLSGRR